MMRVVVRKAIEADISEIVCVHVETWQQSYRGYVADDVLNALSITEQRIEKMRKAVMAGLVYVIEDNGKVCGFAGLRDKPAKTTEIQVFYIHPSLQRQGLGQKLWQFVLMDLKQTGCETVCVWTLSHYPPSNHFYVKNGGQLTGKTQKGKFDLQLCEYHFNISFWV